MQNLKMSISTQSPVPVLKAIKSAEEDEYLYSRLLKVKRKMSTGTQSLVLALKDVKGPVDAKCWS